MADRVGQQLGNYRLLRVIGQGAFAEVYLAEHLYLERAAAIKILHVQMEPQAQEQFRVEARTIAHLQHPHIVSVFDFGIAEQTPYLAMEYTPGGTLRSQHPKGTRLPFEQIVTYVKQIASALDYAHQQRVIHRDVKPANLLLNARGEVVLSDFGLAVVQRTLESLSTQEPAGTPLYMAPEQIRHHPCAASDQYALGIMVYQWLCGEPPFGGQLYAVLAQHLSEPPPSLCERLPDLPRAVEDAVFGALAKEPGHRFTTVQDFALALEEACFGTQPVSLSWSADQQSPDQDAAPAMPSVLLTPQRTGNGQPLLAPRPAPQQQTTSKVGKPTLAHSNRQRFLRRVRAFWIEGVLSHSLHGAALITLGLQEQLDALTNPWHLVLQHPDTAPRALPAGTRITDAYDAANGELLILGAPGSGKTTLLLELARDLLDRAEHDEQHLLPVVFTLSSWAAKQQPLTEWMVEELISKYQVPRKLARTWVDADLILPLLDGLDEVALENRTACIATINTYREAHGLLPLVVASRSADYLEQTGRLRLSRAVTIQSLTKPQVDDYLARGGESLWALRVALHQDATLRELTETPLMLSILTLTYHDMPVEDLLRGGIAPTRQQVFERYTERMLERRGSKALYRPERTIHWLAWLARQMREHNQSVFYLEYLQPDWLAPGLVRTYAWLAVRLPSILIGVLTSLGINLLFFSRNDAALLIQYGVLGGLLGGLFSRASPGSASLSQQMGSQGRARVISGRLAISVLIGLIVGLSFGLHLGNSYGPSAWLRDGSIYGLVIGLGSLLLQFMSPVASGRTVSSGNSRQQRWKRLVRFLQTVHGQRALRVGLSFGLSAGLSAGLSFGLNYGLNYGLSFGLNYGLSSVLVSLILEVQAEGIHLAERLRWTWGSLMRSLLVPKHTRTTLLLASAIVVSVGLSSVLSNGLSAGLLYGLSAGLSAGLGYGLSAGLGAGLGYGLSIGPGYWILLGLFQGISNEQIEDRFRRVPNQGIRRSFRNSILMGIISGGVIWVIGTLGIGLILVLGYGLIRGLSVGLGYGLSAGLSAGLSVGLGYGLSAGLSVGWLIGVCGGLIACAVSGGLATLRHYVLRVLLWHTHTFPWNAPRFLDDATARILLRRVGGGYSFVHRLILDYFASLDTRGSTGN